jgi:hypothetical protein
MDITEAEDYEVLLRCHFHWSAINLLHGLVTTSGKNSLLYLCVRAECLICNIWSNFLYTPGYRHLCNSAYLLRGLGYGDHRGFRC